MNKFEYKYFNQEDLLIYEARDDLRISDLLEMVEILAEYAKNSTIIRVLLDLRFFYANYEINEQVTLINAFNELFKKSCTIKIADIVNSPRETSFALIFLMELKTIDNVEFEVFCTREAGMNWLEN
ncbi:hypothetical protein [Draconibacterium sediminis]|uniref:STAS/SEC14 domain-containing protein n=1 Tax=Draconibacterium sediminis TaxID=1544798 RepID=A0A0D8J5H7_9BACT|nr:hypothetical protein [Draconibacterium sediminis]KJF42172.1 hypothetical protein LH29_20425 [Draconibacterium sediminis]